MGMGLPAHGESGQHVFEQLCCCAGRMANAGPGRHSGLGRWGVEQVEPEVPLEKWQALEAVWTTILGLETSIDTLRMSLDSVRSEMEAAFRKSLNVEEKVHALQADVAQWTKAKNRVHYALPKVREFIHRATWAQATPE